MEPSKVTKSPKVMFVDSHSHLESLGAVKGSHGASLAHSEPGNGWMDFIRL